MDNLTLFISSSDAYQDCWTPFFTLLRRHWPDCDLPIVLNTEDRSLTFDGLDIRCTKTGRQKHFGETFQKGLEAIETDNVLLLMIDYFLMSPVDTGALCNAYRAFIEENLDCLYLVELRSIRETAPLRENCRFVTAPGPDRFSFQAGIWKKRILKEYVLSHETPWLAEQFGSRRFAYRNDRIAYVLENVEPFKYLHTGVIHKGGWVPEAVTALEDLGIKLDWSRRGLYNWRKPSLLERVQLRRQTAVEEMKSRLHLMDMKRARNISA
jgi:hypothetical protein